MVKKESAKRGYMTTEDVEEHVKQRYKNKTEKEQMSRLNKVAYRGRDLLPQETQDAVRAHYNKISRKINDEEIKVISKKVAEDYEKQGKHENAAANWARAGDNERAAEQYQKSADGYETGGDLPYARILREKAANYYELSGKVELSIEILEKLGEHEKAEALRKTAGPKKDLTSHFLFAITSIAAVLGGTFFLSSSITGNAISDMTIKTTSFLGVSLLIVGLVAGFFWLKGKKQKMKRANVRRR